MKPFRNIYTKLDESVVKEEMTGELEIPYTGEIFYSVVTSEEHAAPEGYDPNTDIYYVCPCEFKEIKSFKKV